MQNFVVFVLFSIFLALSSIHVYWAFGGRWGIDAALPTTEDNKKLMNPRFLASMIVGGGLLGFGLIVLQKGKIISLLEWNWLNQYGLWIIIFIFLARAIGEFRYVGFFKKVKNTPFGKLDTKFYSPLCFLISILAFILELF
ncbi:MAG: DUF3995 domain-containing protein [Raineya sp.]|jgi:hypothetical protein|nr:DUF3995 domain-containing protein [Raineya sp.]